jgi:hypothetical protein
MPRKRLTSSTFFRQYFYVRHRINLHYPHLPLVGVMGGRTAAAPHMFYYPLECLQLLEIKDEEEDEKENKKPTP